MKQEGASSAQVEKEDLRAYCEATKAEADATVDPLEEKEVGLEGALR